MKTSWTRVAQRTEQQLTAASRQMQAAASSRTHAAGGSHSGKNGLVAYSEKVRATMAWEQGRTIIHSTHSLEHNFLRNWNKE